MFRKFKFEQAFYDKLRCIPFSTRHKLDLAGVKLSLRSWNLFSEAERQKLCEMPAQGDSAPRYRETLLHLLEKHGESAKFLEPIQLEGEKAQWGDPQQVPGDVAAKISQLGLTLQPEDWRDLDDLQRVTLFKLSQGTHDPPNL